MKYVVYALRSWTFCRVWDVPELFYRPIKCGTYTCRKNAKKKAREWRRDRVTTSDKNSGAVTDHGPVCRKVWIVETE